MKPEQLLYLNVARYLNLQYPSVEYRFDYGAGVRLSMVAAKFQKRIQKSRAFPDLIILHKGQHDGKDYSGLLIELKPDGTRLLKKDGTPASPHIAEQMLFIHRINRQGQFYGCFGVGFDDTKSKIDQFLAGYAKKGWKR